MYTVQSTNNETLESVLIGEYSTEAEAIAKAESAAADAEFDGPACVIVVIAVNGADGNEIWNNEGDWRNAVR